AGRRVDSGLAVQLAQGLRQEGERGAVSGVNLDHVTPGATLELARSALGDDPALVDDHDVGGELVGLLEVLGRQQDVRAAGDHGPDGVPKLDPAARVE